jgi:hypothetical protein
MNETLIGRKSCATKTPTIEDQFLPDVPGFQFDRTEGDILISLWPDDGQRLDDKLRRADLRARRVVRGETTLQRMDRSLRYSQSCRLRDMTRGETIRQYVGLACLAYMLVFWVWPTLRDACPHVPEAARQLLAAERGER